MIAIRLRLVGELDVILIGSRPEDIRLAAASILRGLNNCWESTHRVLDGRLELAAGLHALLQEVEIVLLRSGLRERTTVEHIGEPEYGIRT